MEGDFATWETWGTPAPLLALIEPHLRSQLPWEFSGLNHPKVGMECGDDMSIAQLIPVWQAS